MTKDELIQYVVEETDADSTAQVARVVKAVLDGITQGLKKSGEVRLVGFGTFTATKMKAREATNPQTGDKIKIPARKRAKFKASKTLHEAVA